MTETTTHHHLPMFCDQCEQTAHGTGCSERGVCGKDPDVESLQKVLLYGLKGMAAYKAHARRLGGDVAVEVQETPEAIGVSLTAREGNGLELGSALIEPCPMASSP